MTDGTRPSPRPRLRHPRLNALAGFGLPPRPHPLSLCVSVYLFYPRPRNADSPRTPEPLVIPRGPHLPRSSYSNTYSFSIAIRTSRCDGERATHRFIPWSFIHTGTPVGAPDAPMPRTPAPPGTSVELPKPRGRASACGSAQSVGRQLASCECCVAAVGGQLSAWPLASRPACMPGLRRLSDLRDYRKWPCWNAIRITLLYRAVPYVGFCRVAVPPAAWVLGCWRSVSTAAQYMLTHKLPV